MPLRPPPGARLTPPGSVPPVCDHTIDPAQQALSCVEYDCPVVVEPRSLLVKIAIPPGPAPFTLNEFRIAQGLGGRIGVGETGL